MSGNAFCYTSEEKELKSKYNKLKKKFRQLKSEYMSTFEIHEADNKWIKSLLEERKFLKNKLECFFKS